MGLIAAAYTNARLIQHKWTEADEDRDDLVRTEYFASFMHAAEGLNLPEPDGHAEVMFSVDPAPWAERVMASRSYIDYSRFRNQLGALSSGFRRMPTVGDPFWTMCRMADHAGFFSTAACRRIVADFDTHRDAYRARHDWFDRDRFDAWAAVFRHAADHDGIVVYG